MERSARYTIWYEGYTFYGDGDGINYHDMDNWEEIASIINFYGDDIHVTDNLTGMTFEYGSWH